MSIRVWRPRAPGEVGSQEPKSSREHSRGQRPKVRGRRSGVVRGEGAWEMGKRSGDCGRQRLAQWVGEPSGHVQTLR